MQLNYQDIILQLSEKICSDIVSNFEIITKEKDPELKIKLEAAALTFTNNFLTQEFVYTEQIGFSDEQQIESFCNELDLHLVLFRMHELGLINSIEDALGEEHLFLTPDGKQLTEEYLQFKQEEEE